MNAGHALELETLFGDYPLDRAFDEMRSADGEVRPQYRAQSYLTFKLFFNALVYGL